MYGTIGLDAPTSVYLLDGSSHSVFSARDLNAVAYRQLFYQSPPLDDGEHTLLITNTGTGALWIDYLLYDPPQPVSSSTSSYLSPSTPPSSTSPPTTPTPQNPAINTPEPSSTSFDTGPPGQVNSNIKPSIPISAVVGAAIGALVLIVALIFGMLYYRKRARRLAGAKLLEKNSILGGKMATQVSLHVSSQILIHSLQIPRNSTRPTPVLPSCPLEVHIPPVLISLLVTGAPM